jgi:serine phosphatase RsbU (regulator of sigma subunit)
MAILELPGSIAESLASVVHTQRALAYLQVDAGMTLVGAGGYLGHYGLEAVRVGEPANEQVLFVEGFLPLAESPFFVRSMEVANGRAADLQFYADGESVWILLLDVTAERDATRRMQQKAYEMTLLQEKEATLNRNLQAANAALRAAQAELERSRAALLDAYEALEVELAEAAAYVRSILPAPMSDPFAADWRFVPSTKLGGDCFGYHWVDEGHFAIYLLDVCGHGVGPSLLSVGVLNSLRSGALPNADARDPSQVLGALNGLYQMDRHNGLFFSIWYAVYQPAARLLTFAGAGHPPSVLVRPGQTAAERTELLAGKGPPIGVMPAGNWRSRTVSVTQGSRLYVISDGTFEVRRPDGGMMNFEELVEFIGTAPQGEGLDLDSLLAHLLELQGTDSLDDDFSIVRFDF